MQFAAMLVGKLTCFAFRLYASIMLCHTFAHLLVLETLVAMCSNKNASIRVTCKSVTEHDWKHKV